MPWLGADEFDNAELMEFLSSLDSQPRARCLWPACDRVGVAVMVEHVNQDGVFNSSDLVALGQAGAIPDVDTGEIVRVFQRGEYI